MAQPTFWYGFGTAVFILTFLALVRALNLYIGYLAVTIICLLLIHRLLTDIRRSLICASMLRKTKDIAALAYPQYKTVSIVILEIREHTDRPLHTAWSAHVATPKATLWNAPAVALTREQALQELQEMLIKIIRSKPETKVVES